jgi:hypothetical protein
MFGNCAKVERRRFGGSPRRKREQRAFLHMVFRIFDSPLEAVYTFGNETGETGANLWVTGASKRETTIHRLIKFLMVS